MLLEYGREIISIGCSIEKRVFSGFGVEEAAHGIELTEVESENFHTLILGFGVGIL
jgi:hypothetical protein